MAPQETASYPGKSLAIKNSVLATAWYLISHQTPPDSILDSMMSDWQQAAFAFLETSLHSLTTGNRGATVISRATLVQDHADHGARSVEGAVLASVGSHL